VITPVIGNEIRSRERRNGVSERPENPDPPEVPACGTHVRAFGAHGRLSLVL